MNEIDAYEFTLDYVKKLSKKTSFNESEISYIDYAPISILSNRFSYDQNVLNDFHFIYPILCAFEKAVGELVSRVHDISRATFNTKIYYLISMHHDIEEDEKEKDVRKLILKLLNIEYQEMFSFFMELKEIRNDISHLRFDSLKYKNNLLSRYEVRASLLVDLFTFSKSWDGFRKELLEKGRLPYQRDMK